MLGTQADARTGARGDSSIDLFGGGEPPGILGADGAIQLDVSRIIAKVTRDWDASNPSSTAPLVVSGTTIARVGRALNALPEWGQGGGTLSVDAIPVGTSTDLTITLKANLVRRMPQWTDYPQASTRAKAEWDQMVAKLAVHEDRHVATAVEEAEILAQDLVGQEIAKIASMVTAANRRLAKRQNDMDQACDHGAKEGVEYGDVSLDITVV